MTRFDTTAQAHLRQSSRRLNLLLACALLAIATYLTVAYLIAYFSPYPPYTSFALVLGILVYCFAAIPLTQAVIRRPHPEVVDVREEGLILRFRKGDPVRIAWEDRPVHLAYDERASKGHRRRAEGMEVQVYVPRPGRHPGTEAFRPQELDVSGLAFDEIKRHMRQAGFKMRTRTWGRRRPGEMVEFLRPGDPGFDEEEAPPSRPARRRAPAARRASDRRSESR